MFGKFLSDDIFHCSHVFKVIINCVWHLLPSALYLCVSWSIIVLTTTQMLVTPPFCCWRKPPIGRGSCDPVWQYCILCVCVMDGVATINVISTCVSSRALIYARMHWSVDVCACLEREESSREKVEIEEKKRLIWSHRYSQSSGRYFNNIAVNLMGIFMWDVQKKESWVRGW